MAGGGSLWGCWQRPWERGAWSVCRATPRSDAPTLGRLLRAPFWLPKEWDLALHHRKAGLYLNLGYPLTLDEEFEFALPAKAQPSVLPGVKENTTAPLRWRVEWTKVGEDRLVARLRTELAHGELTVAETPVVQSQLRELLAALAAGASLSAAP